jgi:hypothetical protein
LRHVDVGPVGQWGVPMGPEKIRNWPRYALDPFAATDLDFDVILVGGRFRAHCLLAVANCANGTRPYFFTIMRFGTSILSRINTLIRSIESVLL